MVQIQKEQPIQESQKEIITEILSEEVPNLSASPQDTNPISNEIINALDKYLNSAYESDYEDYVEPSSLQLPQPKLLDNGMWKIPGTNKEYETPQHAYNALRRYTEDYRKNQASIIVYGVPYEEYVNGDIVKNGEQFIKEIQSSDKE